MKKWRIDYAYRVGGEYKEDSAFVIAMGIKSALSDANMGLSARAYKDNWDVNSSGDRYMIWNIGIVAEADDEVF